MTPGLHVGVNAASVAESALMTLLMLAKRVREQHTTFQQRGLGRPLGTQLAGKTLGIVGMGAIGDVAHFISCDKGMSRALLLIFETG